MTSYPMVLGELETLKRVVAGASIARYGDGEFKMATGHGIKPQDAHPVLAERLRDILHDSGDCLVGIPNIRSNTPKAEFWGPQMKFAKLLANRPYVSSFISRPDSAPWIDNDEYWALMESLWIGQDVTLVRGSHKSLAPDDLFASGDVGQITDIVCPKRNAFVEYDDILQRIGTPKRALICLGPTATVLCVDLCKRGVHAVDLGHTAIFLRKRRRHQPMVVTDEDKAVDRELLAAEGRL